MCELVCFCREVDLVTLLLNDLQVVGFMNLYQLRFGLNQAFLFVSMCC